MRTADLLFAGLALAALAFVVYGGRHMTFFGDEWDFITLRRTPSIDALLQAHNEHWSLVLVLLYDALFALFGLTTYLPYLAVLACLHVTAASGVYVALRRVTNPEVALLVGALMLFLGSGYENLVWAFQMGFIGAAAAGIWALVILLDARTTSRHLIAGLLLVVAVATQGVGLFFLASCLVYLLARRTPAAMIAVAIAPAMATYGTWYLTYGRSMVAEHRDPFTISAVQQLPGYILSGGSGAVGAVTGLGPDIGAVIFVVAVAAAAWSVVRGHDVPPLVLAMIAGILVELGLIGLVRAQFGLEQARSSRYLYVSAIFLLVMFGAWVGKVSAPPGRRHHAVLGLICLAVFAAAMNLTAYFDGRRFFEGMANETRAIVNMVESEEPWIDSTLETYGFGVPGAGVLRELVARYGSPASDTLAPGVAAPPPPDAIDRAIRRTAGARFAVEERSSVLSADRVLVPARVQDVGVQTEAACVKVRATGPDPAVYVSASGEQALTFTSAYGGEARVYLSLNAAPQEAASISFQAYPEQQYYVRFPPAPPAREWLIRFDPPPGTSAGRLCWAG